MPYNWAPMGDGSARLIPRQYVKNIEWEAPGPKLMHVYPATEGPITRIWPLDWQWPRRLYPQRRGEPIEPAYRPATDGRGRPHGRAHVYAHPRSVRHQDADATGMGEPGGKVKGQLPNDRWGYFSQVGGNWTRKGQRADPLPRVCKVFSRLRK